MFQNSMRLTKLMRQIDRVQDPETSMDEIFDVFKKQHVKIKLKGIFFSSESFEEEIKLPTDENDKLTAKGLETLTAWWKALEDKDRKAFHKGGALLTAQYMGFRFADRTDEELEAAFKAVNADSGTSLEKLTSDFTPADEDKAKFVFRFLVLFSHGSRDAIFLGVDAEWVHPGARLFLGVEKSDRGRS